MTPTAEHATRQRAGGVAALVGAASFVFGFALYAGALSDYTTGDPTPEESVAFLLDHRTTFYVWNGVIYLLFGLALAVVVLAMHERLRVARHGLTTLATAFGIIWVGLVLATGMIANIAVATLDSLHDDDPAMAAPVWAGLDAVQGGLGGGNEIVGGLWLTLACWVARSSRALPAPLVYTGIAVGLAGVVTTVPALAELGAAFGIGMIIWFTWLGLHLLAQRPTHTLDVPEGLRAGLGR